MAPCGEDNLLVYGGIEEGMHRCGYDDNGDPIHDGYLSSRGSVYVDSEEEK